MFPSELILAKKARMPRDFHLGASLFAPLGLLQTGVTRYPYPKIGLNVRTFLPFGLNFL